MLRRPFETIQTAPCHRQRAENRGACAVRIGSSLADERHDRSALGHSRRPPAASNASKQEGLEMDATVTTPKPREIAGSLRAIRSRWNRQERERRREMARAKQRELFRCLGADDTRLDNAV